MEVSETARQRDEARSDKATAVADPLSEFASVRWSAEQARAARLVEAGHNVFLSGSGGSGKSLLLRYMIARARARERIVHVTGSTGMAAVNVGGRTLHSVVGCGLGDAPLPTLQAGLANRPKVVARWRAMHMLVIDEVSMVDAEFMHKCDQLARWMRGRPNEAFGGIQVILVGDFAQLPPVLDRQPPGAPERPQFCFELPLWVDPAFDLRVVDLRTVFRQGGELAAVLNRMRFGEHTPDDEAVFAARVGAVLPATDGVEPTRLCALSDRVSAINATRLQAIPGAPEPFDCRIAWRADEGVKMTPTVEAALKGHGDKMKQHAPAAPHIDLKAGSQVLLLANLDVESGLVNGARGVVRRFATAAEERARIEAAIESIDGMTDADRANAAAHGVRVALCLAQEQPGDDPLRRFPVVAFACGVEARIVPHKWSVTDPGVGTVDYWQVPLLLAWAMTIHKCQGMSLDRAVISMAGIFDCGQAYVALSRIRSLDGLSLDDFDPRAVRVHPKVLHFYRNGFRPARSIPPVGPPLDPTLPKPSAAVGSSRVRGRGRGRGSGRGRGASRNGGNTTSSSSTLPAPASGSRWAATAGAAGGDYGRGRPAAAGQATSFSAARTQRRDGGGNAPSASMINNAL
ncbi:helicase [Pandoravirus neocaledonia]|uniref:DNA helicase PIF1, ATP-dependent n=1 Tax=Pandoravirus neocaledonia TaxID=2107708 RepID=A0A2U7UC04_9VIRU|nr:helicase [Pandoravirus neocaledonia]AVK75922.1 DNA helicase PIF1, ATP-dependent [Pandoravirus neocaledonia]